MTEHSENCAVTLVRRMARFGKPVFMPCSCDASLTVAEIAEKHGFAPRTEADRARAVRDARRLPLGEKR